MVVKPKKKKKTKIRTKKARTKTKSNKRVKKTIKKPTKTKTTKRITKRTKTPTKHIKLSSISGTSVMEGTDGMKVLLDANFLMIPGKFKVDVFQELQMFGRPELFTLDKVIKELEKIARDRSQDSMHARMGLFLVDSKGISVIKSKSGSTDKELGRIAKAGDYVVCTQDRELIKILRKMSVKVISLRQRKYLIRI